ncbi:hypothetical protein [Anabaena sp. CCY 9910]|uniref:hypothetical protein n=1 Tax=Anabaena sp. CCY 9910 TaxID=3103870 RepID=UPI0039E0064E
MTKTKNIAIHYIGFYSSSKMQEHKPSIRESENYEYPGRYKYTFHTKGYPNLEAVKNHSDEELIRYLNSEGFNDIEFYPLEGWIGFKQIVQNYKFGWEG